MRQSATKPNGPPISPAPDGFVQWPLRPHGEDGAITPELPEEQSVRNLGWLPGPRLLLEPAAANLEWGVTTPKEGGTAGSPKGVLVPSSEHADEGSTR